MVSRNQLENDDRFYVSPAELDVLFDNLVIYDYEYINISLGRLRRFYKNQVIPIDNTINYRFLINPDSADIKESYDSYCLDKSNLSDNALRSTDVFLKLKDVITYEDYNPQKGVVIINQYNIIEDGLHRSCILLSRFGEDYEIPVLKIRRKCARKLIVIAPFTELRIALMCK